MNSPILFRASRFGDLCGSVSKSELTPKQESDLNGFIEREKEQSQIIRDLDGLPFKGSPKPLTPNQREEMQRLIAKRDAKAELPDTAKTWVREMFNENVRGTWKANFSNMHTQHGNEAEKSAIKRIAKVLGVGMCLKSSVTLIDTLGDGHPDVYKRGIVGFDAKCSFTDNTFPLWDDVLKNKLYEWQAKRYLMMAQAMGDTKLDSWYICYSLENASDEVVMKDALKLWRDSEEIGYILDKNGNFINSRAKQFYDEVKQMHTFDNLPGWARVKTFEVKVYQADHDLAAKRVEMGRKYYAELEEKYKSFEK